MNARSTRDQIIETADRLFYQNGYEHTSFADIAEAVGISRGNFYHHFKTKDGILEEVIRLRLAKTEGLLARWEREGRRPEERIRSFVGILIANQTKIMRHGCPVGTLCNELAKLAHPAKDDAAGLFALFRAWLRRQFELLGRTEDADELAMHLLARSQGVATLANAFQDERFIEAEVRRMHTWLNECATQAGQVVGPPARPSPQ